MTNDELIQLVQQKTPDELTPAEIKLLRSRMRKSPEVREAVAENLEIEEFLFQSLGQVDLPIDEIVAGAGRKKRRRAGGWFGAISLLLLVAIGIGVAVALNWDSIQNYLAEKAQTPNDPEPDNTVDDDPGDDPDKPPVDDPKNNHDPKDDPPSDTGDPESEPNTDKGDDPPNNPKSAEPKDPPGDKPNVELPKEDPKPDPPEPKILTPWQEVIENDADARPFEQVAFQQFDYKKSLTHMDDLKAWFEAVPGQRSRFFQQNTRVGSCGWFEGVVRLKSPWLNDTALRLSMESYNRLQIHFFSGTSGVTLSFHEDRNFAWAGYTTTRKQGAVDPETFSLTAHDEGRNARTEVRFGGPMELRHRDGEIILSRGDIVLIRAPLAGKIDDVYFKGRGAFFGIKMIRTQDFPAQDPPNPIVADYDRPADLPWVEKLDETVKFEKLEDGRVRLSANQAKLHSWAATPLPTTGIHEVILELDNVKPGAGVFLGNETDGPIRVLRFFKNTRDNRLFVTYVIDGFQADVASLNERLLTYCAEHVWIKLLASQGTMRFWMSSDGVHWGRPEAVYSNDAGRATHVGLHQFAVAPESTIELRRLTIRKLPILSSLARAEVIARASANSHVQNFEQWKVAVVRSRPVDVEMDEWIHANVIRTLNAGSNQEFANRLLELVLDSRVVRAMPLDQQLDLLDEVCQMADFRNRDNLLSMVKRFYDVGLAAYEHDKSLPHSYIRRALMNAPLAMSQNIKVADEQLVRIELLELLGHQKWSEAINFCRRLRFYQQHQQLPLVDWAEATARRQLPRSGLLGTGITQKAEWEHPFDVELDKEAYNIMAELHALLASDAAEEVAKMITSIDPKTFVGVAPQGKDRDHYVSFGSAVQMAIRSVPRLRQEIERRYGQLAQLRIRKAIASGDEEAVKLASMQFESTSSAAEAHAWLGDRALSSGWFPRAMAEYRRAILTAGPTMRDSLTARMRLAGAMMGQMVGDPITAPVTIGDLTFSADEFEALINEMAERDQYQSVVQSNQSGTQALPTPTGLKLERKGRLEGIVGESPTTEITRHVRRHKVDWVGRQIATLLDGNTLLVSNRFQIMAFDLAKGQLLWQTEHLDDTLMRSQDWGLTAMQPLVTDQQVFARLMFGSSPQLACFDKTNGSRIWTTKLPGNEHLVSDPMIIQDQLVALSMVKGGTRSSVLRLTRFARQTGEIIQQDELTRVRESWWRRRFCAAIPHDASVIASLGGFTISCDLSGDIRWVRRQVVTPTEEEHTWVRQAFQAPLLANGRLFVAQPAVRSVECLDPDTGERIWNAVLPNGQRLVGVTDKNVIVKTAGGFVALNRKNGQANWRTPANDCLEAMLVDKKGRLAFTQLAAPQRDETPPVIHLSWLDTSNGKIVATSDIKGVAKDEICAGPMLIHEKHMWMFIGQGLDIPQRDLAQLVVDGKPIAKKDVHTTTDVLSARVEPSLLARSKSLLGDWTLFNGALPAESPEVDPSDELQVDCLAGSNVLLGRSLKVADVDDPRIRIQLGHVRAYLTLTVDAEVIFDGPVEAKFPEQEWKMVDIDLSKFRGKTVWITASSRSSNPAEKVTTRWKPLKVAP